MVARAIRKSVKPRTAAKKEQNDCPHCVGGEETYGYLKRAWVYDVDQARRIVSDGREAVEIDTDDVDYFVDNSRIHEQHLDHVNPIYPVLREMKCACSNGDYPMRANLARWSA
jgi:hypothetical protein